MGHFGARAALAAQHDEARSQRWGHPTCALPWTVEGGTVSTGKPVGKPAQAKPANSQPRSGAAPLVCRWRRGPTVWRCAVAAKHLALKDLMMRIIAL